MLPPFSGQIAPFSFGIEDGEPNGGQNARAFLCLSYRSVGKLKRPCDNEA
jgi:hypothetical protein